MFKKSIILLLLLVPLALAEPNVFLTFSDVTSKETVQDVFVNLKIDDHETHYFIEDSLRLSLEEGVYTIHFLINDPNTEGSDYYGSTTIIAGENTAEEIRLFPIGSINGFVKDKLDNVIGDAELKFECNEIFPVEFPSRADHFGSFYVDAVPIGNCKIYGSYDNQVGVQEIEVKKGEKSNVNIQLDQVLITEEDSYSTYVVLIMMLVILALIILFVKIKKKPIKEKPKEALKEKNKLGQRGNDLLKTLRDNEKKIVNFLLEYKQATHLSKIHYKTGISKGSLFRNLRSLEQKNIIETFSEGRVKKVKLSKWFME